MTLSQFKADQKCGTDESKSRTRICKEKYGSQAKGLR